jgi:SAM-dependent methyltransferase
MRISLTAPPMAHQSVCGSVMMASSRERTIADFGEQWNKYSKNEGYYASDELFADLTRPLVEPREFSAARVADIGSGTGRIVRMLAHAGAAHILAVEPSNAFDRLVHNTADLAGQVRCLRGGGEDLPTDQSFDWVVSFGVLHHIPDPDPVMRRAYEALRPGGHVLVWLYGREGNRMYLAVAEPLRKATIKVPHLALAGLCHILDLPLRAYVHLCRLLPLPMASYMTGHVARLSPDVRRLTIYDQLNPTYAKYYTHDEARSLLERAGFVDVRLHHRHGYSWLALGKRSD